MPETTIESLDKTILKLVAERDSINARLVQLHADRDALYHAEHARRMLAALPASQRDAVIRLAALQAPTGLAAVPAEPDVDE